MKTVAGIADKRSELRVAQSFSPEIASASSSFMPARLRRKRSKWMPLCVLFVALIPSCNSLWHSYLEPCDPAMPMCVTMDAGAPDLVPPQPQLVPSNGIDPAWFAEAKVELRPTDNLVIDTDQGTVQSASSSVPMSDVIYHQIAPVDCGSSWLKGIGVFAFTRIHIPDGVTVRFIGSRAVALIAAGPIQIDGLLDLRGGGCTDPRCGAPGGFEGGHVRSATKRGQGPGGGTEGYGIGGLGEEAGGGGAGSCGQGGKGGDAGNDPYFGGAGGSSYLKDALIPLCGGSGGGAGGFGTTTGESGQRGGGGGGAIQIVSQQSVIVDSTDMNKPSGIHVGGGGGQSDIGVNFNDGGGGGGSGGAILIEAPTISILSGAVLAANGGGGGGGFNGVGTPTNSGESAKLSSVAALGGVGSQSSCGAGGAGQINPGGDAIGPKLDGGAGGGGGVGRIRLNSSDGNVSITGVLSPALGKCASTGRVTMR